MCTTGASLKTMLVRYAVQIRQVWPGIGRVWSVVLLWLIVWCSIAQWQNMPGIWPILTGDPMVTYNDPKHSPTYSPEREQTDRHQDCQNWIPSYVVLRYGPARPLALAKLSAKLQLGISTSKFCKNDFLTTISAMNSCFQKNKHNFQIYSCRD